MKSVAVVLSSIVLLFVCPVLADDFEPEDYSETSTSTPELDSGGLVVTTLGVRGCRGRKGYRVCDPTQWPEGDRRVQPAAPANSRHGIGVNTAATPVTMMNPNLNRSLSRAQQGANSQNMKDLCCVDMTVGCFCNQLPEKITVTSKVESADGWNTVWVCVEKTVGCVEFCPANAVQNPPARERE